MSSIERPKSVLGIDLGSRYVKLSHMIGGKVVHTRSIETIKFYRQHGVRSEAEFRIDMASLGIESATCTVATGYGRMAAVISGAENISEISAHYLGAVHQTGFEDFTLLDIGGQDFKIISSKQGELDDFVTNDKCAASTGRYLENMAQVLGISLEEIGRYSENPVSLSNTCAIFSESELVGLIVKGKPVSELAAGVNRSIVERFMPLLNRFGDGLIVLSGGVALNQGVIRIMGDLTGREVMVVEDPLHNGAIGCCVRGEEILGK